MVELFIAVRHLKERKFQSVFSILGVAISVTVLMVSLTVSNGLEKNMLKSLLTLNPHIILTKGNGDVAENYMEVKKKNRKYKRCKRCNSQIYSTGNYKNR